MTHSLCWGGSVKILNNFYQELWQQYTDITPQALAIQHLFENEGEALVNDHVAFRTFAHSNISIDHLETQILALGYEYLDSYHFKNKKLDARCYVHTDSPTKIFISELLWLSLSELAQRIIAPVIQQINLQPAARLNAGRVWDIPTYENYLTLLDESEYAAWLLVWGLRANHFTVYVNHLKKYSKLSQVVELLQRHGYALNSAGGVIKGTKEDLLIQASTMADSIAVSFPDVGEQQITSCYYEFAQRFEKIDGSLYQGFVASSADKIFESTNRGMSDD